MVYTKRSVDYREGGRIMEITREMMEAVALSLLYNEREDTRLRQIIQKKMSSKEMEQLIKDIKLHPDFKDIKEDIVKIESAGLIDDNMDTILLQYNKMLQNATFEGKYDIAMKILKEIKQIKSIDNTENEFKITINYNPKDVDEIKAE